MRLLIVFCVGVGATLAWQSYGDVAREMIASSHPQFGWLAPQSAFAQTAPATIVPPITSPDPQELKTISSGLAAMRRQVEELAANQDQTRRDITAKVQVAKQEILDKISVPSPQPTLARKLTPPAPPATPVR